jgi:bis(5'-nucleosyl)-tetraphosphatase (symmetrical)
LNIIFADDADFEDDIFPGIYPLSSQGQLSALKLAASPERISIACSEELLGK